MHKTLTQFMFGVVAYALLQNDSAGLLLPAVTATAGLADAKWAQRVFNDLATLGRGHLPE
jgi:hypothetical protein